MRGKEGERMDKGTFEYEIRKDFRNNQIVREVDERRLRDLWQSLAVGAAAIRVCVCVVLPSTGSVGIPADPTTGR